MASVADLERLLERVFERSVARLFRTRIQPVQLEHRVERAMERARAGAGGRTVVPRRYVVRMDPVDLADVAARGGGADALAARLADAALAFARGHGFRLPGRPSVSLVADPSVDPGQVQVDAVADPERPWQPAFGGPEPADGASPTPSGPHSAASAPLVASPARPPTLEPVNGGIRGDGSQTLVFRRPVPEAAHAVLREVAPDGRERTVEVDGSVLTIGRARDNGLVLPDGRVSRHHGRLQARRGTLVYADLGSTNGSRVNGIRVDEIVLGAGDRLEVGDTVLVVETLPG